MVVYLVVGAFVSFVVLAMVLSRGRGGHGGSYDSDNSTWDAGGDSGSGGHHGCSGGSSCSGGGCGGGGGD
jgi:hypothetical protein